MIATASSIVGDLPTLVDELADQLWNAYSPAVHHPLLVGIPTRGYFLARRVAQRWESLHAHHTPVGQIDISFHRDDYSTYLPSPHPTRLLEPIEGRLIILVDDVFHTGRTVRAALEALHALGRPAAVRLAVLIDRCAHELPIRPDLALRSVSIDSRIRIKIKMHEVDQEDAIYMIPVA
ncbi:MAG: bifunctional pyr operon transcriptional regulator/uracil phosphoribosyltransferase PyrR [Methylacidiphilales bacterium]|nr:bifunctional pyr operon transcriptional regulator/uracil phosphoribosyltransferase PyrR [Candidatus Methylacidiphilales bacterium]MDW8349770.1 bifunctional pyr operon transcriptional regulator/uracil phosphoribosyltransferase PyrR [Verrucomicrobiae bacterium]